jgi:hypothetical protein
MFAPFRALPSASSSVSYAVCFDTLTKPFSHIPFPLIAIQNPRGWGYALHTLGTALFCSFHHSLAESGNSSPFPSTHCALFAETPGGVPKLHPYATRHSERPIWKALHFPCCRPSAVPQLPLPPSTSVLFFATLFLYLLAYCSPDLPRLHWPFNSRRFSLDRL